jgi:hypothetical protein
MITNINIGRYGRLGNQLYQYASAFSLAKKLETELWIPQESENYNTVGRYNPVINSNDSYSNDLFRLFKLKFGQKKPLNDIQKEIRHFYNENNVVKYYPEFWNLKDNTSLHGYFQAKEYVDEYQSELRNELEFQDYFFDYGIKIIDKLNQQYNRIVSLHIRRGDGLMDNFAFNANLTIDGYYKKIISENVKENDVIIVFSDDIDWCKNILKGDNIIFIDNRNSELSHLKDFALMSMCDLNIMAVSTYSWWACWLNPLNKDKQVFMPNKWWGWSLSNNSEEIYRYDKWKRYNNE